MTGFGVASRPWAVGGGSATVHVEARSVNARFLEVKVRQPFGAAVDSLVRGVVERQVGRGRVDVSVHLQRGTSGAGGDGALSALGIDGDRVTHVVAAVREIEQSAALAKLELGHANAVELLRFLATSGSRSASHPSTPVGEPPAFLDELVSDAVLGLVELRVREGAALALALGELAATLGGQVTQLIEALAGESDRIGARLHEQARKLCESAKVPAPEVTRVHQELALLLSRSDIEEELARIRSHLAQMHEVLEAEASPGQGKTLEFLTQELFREVTTCGSKIASPAGGRVVIDAKGTIERIREQVQNVE